MHGGRGRAGRRPGIVAQPAVPDACRGRGIGFSREPWLLPLRRRGEVGRGWSRLALIPKAPLPNPSGPPAQLACVRRPATPWFASAPPHPLPSQGRELGHSPAHRSGSPLICHPPLASPTHFPPSV